MKSKSTFKSLMVSGLLLMVGAAASAQDNSAAGQPIVTQSNATYSLTFPENLGGMTSRSGFTVASSIDQISIQEIHRNGSTIEFTVDIPAGTPIGSIISIKGAGTPLWHVTVADILGNSQSDDEVAMRPLDDPHAGSGVGNNPNPNAISQPAPTSVSSGTGLENAQPKFELYPNPTVEFLTIVTEGEVLWGVAEVIDPTGKKVLELPTGSNSASAGISKFTLNVSDLRAGMYFVRVRVGNEFLTKRFFVSK